MKITNPTLYGDAVRILKTVYGPNAQFRDGQYEAIEATMMKRRTLVVQKTGWGKSLVYFICTKLKRSRGQGFTLVISPLLVLMENQMEMATELGLRCAALNSNVKDKDERKGILERMKDNRVDIVFITPETLLKDEIQKELPEFRIGLFVVDEAHCISDWGHDFRLDYSKLGRIIRGAFSNVPVLATTATANDRVVNDLKCQLGDDVFISRGPLTRESLHIQVLHLEKRHERYAWLLDNLSKLPGTGIIYCLDRRDCDYLAAFLAQNGIAALPYHSGDGPKQDESNARAMEAFRNNELKAIVATVKLGMGYDKGDVSFVIHFQMPSGIVSWYQQIGRAGRNLKTAYVYLMAGTEDDAINEYFIKTAFPTKAEAQSVIEFISAENGVTRSDILAKVNARPARVDKVLNFMESDGFIRREKIGTRMCYFSTARRYVYPEAHYKAISDVRRKEVGQMHELIQTHSCLSRFAVNYLDDHEARDCGKCFNCTGRDIFPGLSISEQSKQLAADFIDSGYLTIEPRKKFPDCSNIPKEYRMQAGICLCKYGDPGYGEMVASGKYSGKWRQARFDDRLVTKSANVLCDMIRDNGITHITYVPSLRSDLVKDFAMRLARKTRLCLVDLLEKTQAPPQKNMENSAHQFRNAMESFTVITEYVPQNVLLVDDVVDSRWTLAVCAMKILEKVCTAVYPFALADSSSVEG